MTRDLHRSEPHPGYVEKMTGQLNRIGFYSNAVRNPLQDELALLLGKVSGYPEYNLFLCNSGAEANENALKLASLITDRSKILAMRAGVSRQDECGGGGDG